MARPAVVAGSDGTVIDVDGAVLPRPPVDADAAVAAAVVDARAPVATRTVRAGALVHVLRARRACNDRAQRRVNPQPCPLTPEAHHSS